MPKTAREVKGIICGKALAIIKQGISKVQTICESPSSIKIPTAELLFPVISRKILQSAAKTKLSITFEINQKIKAKKKLIKEAEF